MTPEQHAANLAAQVAEAEAQGDYALADRLKVEQLRSPRVPSLTPAQRAERIAQIVDTIAITEARGMDARPLKAEWATLLADAL